MLKSGLRDLRKLAHCVDVFRNENPEIPAQQIAVFLIVAMNEGCSLADITERLGMASSTTSRSVDALSKLHRLGKPGLDLVEKRIDPMDRRKKTHHLTPKGHAAKTRILDELRS